MHIGLLQCTASKVSQRARITAPRSKEIWAISGLASPSKRTEQGSLFQSPAQSERQQKPTTGRSFFDKNERPLSPRSRSALDNESYERRPAARRQPSKDRALRCFTLNADARKNLIQVLDWKRIEPPHALLWQRCFTFYSERRRWHHTISYSILNADLSAQPGRRLWLRANSKTS